MCQATITPSSIRSQGPITVFENANTEGMVEIYFPVKDVAHLYNRKISMEDMVNHLFRRTFSASAFSLHRISTDNKHYRKCNTSVFWNEDGSLYFCFNVLKLIGLQSFQPEKELTELLTLFKEFKAMCVEFPEMDLSLGFADGQLNIRSKYITGDVNKFIQMAERFQMDHIMNSSTSKKLATAICNDNGLTNTPMIDESFLYPIMFRPHINYTITNRS